MKTQEFDYYIYIDYSENLIGYTIIEKCNKTVLLNKIVKFTHFRDLRHKETYLIKIKRIIKINDFFSFIYKYRIGSMWDTLSIFGDIVEFIKKNDDKSIFLLIDDRQYTSFMRLFKEFISNKNVFLMKESELKKGSEEYRLSLIIDNLLNIERRNIR